MNRFIKIGFCALLLMFPLATGAQTSERILLYHSDIEVFEDASMSVKETIRVVSTGDQIRRGIYRDFPIAYKDHLGHRYLVGFELLEVKRDGAPEPYHVERSGNGQRIYIGEEDVFIPPGEHEYQIEYKTTRQLGFFEDHDELYWNVTGNGWVFSIDFATAKVKLPPNVPKEKITTALYTGSQGSTSQEGTWKINDDATVEFATSTPLNSYEGLTIVVGWPKGITAAPTAAENFWATVRANLDYIVGTLGFLMVLAFYFRMWNKHGRDPGKGSIHAQYESPEDLSPAMLRYVSRMGSDNRAFASAIVNMGVKGRLTVTEDLGTFKKATYTLAKKLDKTKAALSKFDLSIEEKLLEDKLFASGESIQLKSTNASKISKIVESFSSSLKQQIGKKYFIKNTFALVLGILFSVLVITATIVSAALVRYEISSALPIIFWPFLAIAFIALNITFGVLMRAYTPEGRKLKDQIDGFKLFLTMTEKERLEFHNPPERTPELFEKMLPYAMALGVEHTWAQQFSDVFKQLEAQGIKYAPAWYYGSIVNFTPDNFASAVGSSFAGAVASASTPPGSSSGSSGGSSGGGGGGGGGGGW